MENKKPLTDEEIDLMTEEEIDLMFERFTDNITVGDPNDFTPYNLDNDPWLKASMERMRERMKFHPRFANGNNNKTD
jgi:hypothetical protein